MLFRRTESGVYLAHNSTVVGDVSLGVDCSVWFNAVIRGDVAAVRIGQRTNVQDAAVIHCDSGVPNEIGDDVVIGHGAVVHGKKVGSGTLIGMSATVLGQTVIGERCLIAAGAVVPPGLHVPDGMVVIGVPGKIVRPTNADDQKYMSWLAKHYVSLAGEYIAGRFAAFDLGPRA